MWLGRLGLLLGVLVIAGCADFLDGGAPPVQDVVYREIDGAALTLDVYRPASGGVTPAVLMFHGGGWVSDLEYGRLDAWGRWFAAHGWTALNVHYRLAQQSPFPAAFLDAVAAVRWVRGQHEAWGIDPERLVLFGNSAGAHLALLAALCETPDAFGDAGDPAVSSRVCGVITFAGPTDLALLYAKAQTSDFLPLGAVFLESFLGGTPEENPDLYRQASPLTWAGPDEPATLLIHGDADTTVPWEQSRMLADVLLAAGNRAELVTLAGASHEAFVRMTATLTWRVFGWQPNAITQIEMFLQNAAAP